MGARPLLVPLPPRLCGPVVALARHGFARYAGPGGTDKTNRGRWGRNVQFIREDGQVSHDERLRPSQALGLPTSVHADGWMDG
ncbi:hypothetical protein LY78DRAFT_661075 [Colletotrichum sublineola]|nr:hypothetical protein LY78DRAFT_661075 [Colletotrichum sublineola]